MLEQTEREEKEEREEREDVEVLKEDVVEEEVEIIAIDLHEVISRLMIPNWVPKAENSSLNLEKVMALDVDMVGEDLAVEEEAENTEEMEKEEASEEAEVDLEEILLPPLHLLAHLSK